MLLVAPKDWVICWFYTKFMWCFPSRGDSTGFQRERDFQPDLAGTQTSSETTLPPFKDVSMPIFSRKKSCHPISLGLGAGACIFVSADFHLSDRLHPGITCRAAELWACWKLMLTTWVNVIAPCLSFGSANQMIFYKLSIAQPLTSISAFLGLFALS